MSKIIFSNDFDHTTNEVLDWVKYLGDEVKIINNFDKATFSVQIENTSDVNAFLNNITITKAWFRKTFKFSNIHWAHQDFEYLTEHQIAESNEAHKALYLCLMEKPNCDVLGTTIKSSIGKDISKPDVLFEAKKAGLFIPSTLITDSKKALYDFIEKHHQVILKTLTNVIPIRLKDDTSYMQYATLLEETDFDDLPDKFFPTMFQKYCDKEYEIRVFYLLGKIYSCAIFSQLQEQAKIDMRVYDYKKEHRLVPYKLPKSIESKIKELMKKFNLNTGSLDFIKSSEDGQYYFLEINPYGQFGMMSESCNYYLEQKIAAWFTKN